jgi:hypothetical protein
MEGQAQAQAVLGQSQALLGQSLMQQLVTNMQTSLIQEISRATLEYEPASYLFSERFTDVFKLQSHNRANARQRGPAHDNDADTVQPHNPDVLLFIADSTADK